MHASLILTIVTIVAATVSATPVAENPAYGEERSIAQRAKRPRPDEVLLNFSKLL
jgi:hypothetical protein